MPKYTLPELKKFLDSETGSLSLDTFRREVSIPVNKEILAGAKVNDEITVVMRGTVIGLDNSETDEVSRQEMRIELRDVETSQEMSEMEAVFAD
jgi:hypothetical protein